jgi:hypothetical protein
MRKNDILSDHKKIGTKLVPPFKYKTNIQEISFRDSTLPSLIWFSAIFLRESDRSAVNNLIEFIIKCNEILGDDQSPTLAYLNNFNKLRKNQKNLILEGIKETKYYDFLIKNLKHQYALLSDYPLAFLFEGQEIRESKEDSLVKLKEDVSGLLDRYSGHSTKVQTTVFVSMTATGKLLLHPDIELPDFNAIFTEPTSDEARHVGSFVRAGINAGHGFGDAEGGENSWSTSFWEQVFKMESCC